jgi:hypothetical protein
VRYRVEVAWLALPRGAVAALDQSQKSESADSEARGRGGLGQLNLFLALCAVSERYLLMRPFDPPFEKKRVPSAINF